MKQILIALALSSSLALAQSSGNFSAQLATTQCTIDVNKGGTLSGGIARTYLQTTLKTPNSNSTALVIRPSLVTGLFTKTRVDNTAGTTASHAGVKVRVLLDDKVVAPGTPVGGTLAGDGWITYDKRFQQLSTNLFNNIFMSTACDDLGTLDVVESCYIEFVLSTLAAHSMDFVAPSVGGGSHTLKVEWMIDKSTTDLVSDAKACVGPGVLTVQQVKTFSTSSGIEIQ